MQIKLNSYLKYYNLFVHMEDYIKDAEYKVWLIYFIQWDYSKTEKYNWKKSVILFLFLTSIYII